MTDIKKDDAVLEALFEAAIFDTPPPSDRLMDRVLADALETIPTGPEAADKRSGVGKLGLFGQIINAIGGWPAVAGLATATVAGVWIGIYPNDVVSDVMAQYSGDDSDLYLVDISTSIGSLFEEG